MIFRSIHFRSPLGVICISEKEKKKKKERDSWFDFFRRGPKAETVSFSLEVGLFSFYIFSWICSSFVFTCSSFYLTCNYFLYEVVFFFFFFFLFFFFFCSRIDELNSISCSSFLLTRGKFQPPQKNPPLLCALKQEFIYLWRCIAHLKKIGEYSGRKVAWTSKMGSLIVCKIIWPKVLSELCKSAREITSKKYRVTSLELSNSFKSKWVMIMIILNKTIKTNKNNVTLKDQWKI